jgi:hypothetical protein
MLNVRKRLNGAPNPMAFRRRQRSGQLVQIRFALLPSCLIAGCSINGASIYHTRVKTFSRAKQHSAVAAAAYRGALCLTDTRTGIVHNYQTRSGVQRVICISPIGAPDWTEDPQQLWSAVEAAEKPKDSTVARDFEIALPHEFSDDQRWELGWTFGSAERCFDIGGRFTGLSPGQKGAPDHRRDRPTHIGLFFWVAV